MPALYRTKQAKINTCIFEPGFLQAIAAGLRCVRHFMRILRASMPEAEGYAPSLSEHSSFAGQMQDLRTHGGQSGLTSLYDPWPIRVQPETVVPPVIGKKSVFVDIPCPSGSIDGHRPSGSIEDHH